MSDCIFCRIVAGEIPADTVYEDDDVLAFRDLEPQAPHHILIIPKRHIGTLNDFTPEDAPLIGKLVLTAQHLAQELGFADAGYRLNWNANADGGQTVFHVHLHLLAGRRFTWPPG